MDVEVIGIKCFQDMDLCKYFNIIVNGELLTVQSDEISPTTTLNSFLRNHLHLKGTKRMCLEGGCGSCIVTVKRRNAVTNKDEIIAVNSCLVSIFSTCNWEIYTIEGLGDSQSPSKLQDVITKFHGTQCGYCTPGMIMNMFALKQKNDNVTMKEVENSFGGNICRCTGYRPILSAFKSVCQDACSDLIKKCEDIEDLPLCKKKFNQFELECSKIGNSSFYFKHATFSWIKVTTLNDLLQVIKSFSTSKKECSNYYTLVAGNTAKGVYKNEISYKVYVDIQDVQDLKTFKISKNGVTLGANLTLTNVIDLFVELSNNNTELKYFKKLADHIDLIANVPVRNVGTLAGNLMIKHKHNNFPSDIFVLLEAVNAKLQIVDIHNEERFMSPVEFLKYDMENKLITTIFLPYLSNEYYFESFKIMRRSQNTHATINTAYLLKISKENVVESANIVIGCFNANLHASQSEKFIIGKHLFNNHVIQELFQKLDEEFSSVVDQKHAKLEYLKKLNISLFYKFILSITPKKFLSPENISGKFKLKRPLSRGEQLYESKDHMYPLSYPMRKREAMHQATGGAEYISDMPDLPNQLHAEFVLAKVEPLSKILKINIEKAMKLDGVVAFFDKNDISGKNTFTPVELGMFTFDPKEEEIFSNGIIKYHSQPVGIIVATSQEIAEKAADLVEIIYERNKEQAVCSIRDAINNNRTDRIQSERIETPIHMDNEELQVVKGTMNSGWQSHFYLETQCCSVVYKEDSLDIYASTQWMDAVQTAASYALNIPSSRINVTVKRIGGAFGGKILRHSIVSTATALAAYKLKKPVKMWLTMEKNFAIIGKRNPTYCEYEVAANKNGKIEYINNTFYIDHGTGGNEDILPLTYIPLTSTYKSNKWCINSKVVNTDMHGSCYVRAPGTVEGVAMIESIMESTAYALDMDPLQFKINNIEENSKILEYVNDLIKWANVTKRKEEILTFNENNMWRKKGISVVPSQHPIDIHFNFGVIVSIYYSDGSVAISHGGIEMGQGIHTKAIQTCAYKLGIPMEKISVKPSNNLTGANAGMSGSSITSEGVCWGVAECCDILLERMKQTKESMKNPTWEELLQECHRSSVNLVAYSMYSKRSPKLGSYMVYSACAAEIELDVLTGQYQINRVDILEDVGDTMNPEIDIGQIEGAFIMGLGYFTTEEIIVGNNGEILTNRTWNYTPPGAKDIPIDFRIKLPGKNPNPVGVLKSKATGEPALCLAVAIPLAIRNAVVSVRKYFDDSVPVWYPFDGPSTVEDTFVNCLHNYKKYTL